MGFKSNSEKCEQCPASAWIIERYSGPSKLHVLVSSRGTQLDFCEYLTRLPSTASPTVYYPEKRIFERIEDPALQYFKLRTKLCFVVFV